LQSSFEYTSTTNIFDTLPALNMFAPAVIQDELTTYLSTPIENIREDQGLAWWETHQSSYPRLSRMARDFLSIPGLL
jgi:hypothetical protein